MGFLNRSVAAVWSAWPRPRQANTPPASDDFWFSDLAQPSQAGIRVTADIALKASAVFACIKILAETIASLPLQMFQVLPDGGRKEAPQHPLDEILRYQPNSWQTAVEFWETVMLQAVLEGGGYAEIVPGPRGAVDQLYPVFDVRITQTASGELVFEVWDPRRKVRRILLQEEVFRVPGLSSDGVQGLRAVDLAADAIGLGISQDIYAAKVFSNKLNIGGFLVHPGRIGAEGQKSLVHELMMRFSGSVNAHRPMVLQEGMDWKQAGQTAKDSQLLEARKWQIGEVARFFRIPLHMLGVNDGATHSNVEQQALDLVKYTLRPWVKRIEQAIRRDLIVARDRYLAKFNMEGLLRGDSEARSNYFSKALGSGGSPAWMTQNEVRMVEGMNRSADQGADRLGVGTNPRTDAAGGGGNMIAIPTPGEARHVLDGPRGHPPIYRGEDALKELRRMSEDRQHRADFVQAARAEKVS